MRFTAEETARAAGGRLRGAPRGEAAGLSLDSRTLLPGEAFAAIRGGRADGHDFAAEAARRGAPFLLVARAVEAPGAGLVLVEEVGRALLALARHLREREALEVVAITGSAGKTTVRELVTAVLQGLGALGASRGNWNSLTGLPLAIANLPEGTHLAVLEAGISAPDEMDRLAAACRPDVAVVTNVAPVHTEFFPDFAALVREKAKLVAGLRPDGVAVWSADDPLLEEAAREALPAGARAVRFGASADAEVLLLEREDLGLDGGRLRVRMPDGAVAEVLLPLPGLYNARNALAALAVGHVLGVPAEEAAARLAACAPLPGRGRVVRIGGVTLLDESYNSNPRALEAVLASVAVLAGFRRKIVAAGDMLELGAEEGPAHEEAGRLAAAAGASVFVGVGPRMRAAVEQARRAGVGEAVHFATSAEAGEWLAREAGAGDLVLVKGSRGMRMENVIETLRSRHAEEGAREPRPAGAGI